MLKSMWGNGTPSVSLLWNQLDDFTLQISKADPKDQHQLDSEINTETLSRLRGKKSQHQWAVDTKDLKGNRCTSRQKACIKVALAKRRTFGAKLKLKACILPVKLFWVSIHFLSSALKHIQTVKSVFTLYFLSTLLCYHPFHSNSTSSRCI